MKKAIADVDAYIAVAPKQAQAALKQLRKIVKAAAPKATESISYHMPFYKLDGAPLAAFAAYKHHVGLYAVPVSQFQRELKGYVTGRGSVQFPLDRPLPAALITRLIAARLKSIKSGKKRPA